MLVTSSPLPSYQGVAEEQDRLDQEQYEPQPDPYEEIHHALHGWRVECFGHAAIGWLWKGQEDAAVDQVSAATRNCP